MYLYLLFFISFIIRLVNLNQSLWLDEATVAKVIRTIPFHLIPFQFSLGDFHPPLYYLGMSIWGYIVGTSEIALRMPSIIFSLITGWIVFQIGTLVKDKKTGFWAALFFLFNPLIIYYSQEARMYMMATMFLTCGLYYFIKLIKESQKLKVNVKNIVLFNIFSVLAIGTFYGSIFFIGAEILVCFFMVRNGRSLSYKLCIGPLLSFMVLFPLLLAQLHNAQIGLAGVKNWSLVLGKAELKNCAMILLKFATGRVSWFPKWSYYLLAGTSSIVVGIGIFLGVKRNKVLAFLFVIPLILGLAISFVAPMMMYFRFLYLLPIMALLLALVDSNRIKYATLAIFLFFSFLYVCIPLFHREDWKMLAKNIDNRIPLYMILPSSDPVTYYDPQAILFDMRDVSQINMLPDHIQVIPYVEEIYGYNHAASLTKKGCIQESKSEYRGPLFLEKWKCPSLFIGHLKVRSI